MILENYFSSKAIILEAVKPYIEHEESACNKVELGFANVLRSLLGADPFQLSPVFAATQRITNAIGMMPFEVKTYEDIEIPQNHYLLHLWDNCVQTKFIFMKNLVKDIIINGAGYAYIVRDDAGKPINLIYLPAGTCNVEHDTTGTKVWYRCAMINKGARIEPINIIHAFMDSSNGIDSRALLDFANRTVRLGQYTEKAASEYFSSGMRLSGVLSTNAPRLTEQQRKDIRQAYLSGLESTSGICVLEAGMTFEPMSSNTKDAQLNESRLFGVQEIARFYNISPTLLGDLSHNQYNSIESALTDFASNTLGPWVTMLEEELNRKLVLPKDRSKYYISLNEDALIKSDRQSYANYLSTLISKGIINVNEARKSIGLKTIGEEGDKFILPYSGTVDSQGNVNTGYNKSSDKNIETTQDEEN